MRRAKENSLTASPSNKRAFAKGTAAKPAVTYSGPRAQRTRELILSTAREMFSQHGFAGTAMEDVAEAAGISRASIYTYFPSKFALFAELGVVAYRAVDDAIGRMGDLQPGWTEAELEEWVRVFLREFDTHQAFVTQWYEAGGADEAVRAAWRKNELRLASHLGGHVRRLRGAGDNGDPALEGLAVIGMISHTWYVWRVAQASFKEPQVVRTLAAGVGAFLRGEASAG